MTDQPFTTQELWELPRVGAPSVSADGRVVVVPVATHDGEAMRTRLWLVAEGAEPRPLTREDSSSTAPAVAPDGRHVAFVRTVDDRRQVHVLPLDGGEARRVTDLPLGVVGSARWADDGRLLVVTQLLSEDPTPTATAAWRDAADDRPNVLATERRFSRAWDTWYVDPLTMHVLLVDALGDAAPVDLTPGEWVVPDPLLDPATLADLSPDGTTLAFTTSTPDGDVDGIPVMRLHVVAVDGGEVRCLTPDDAGHTGPPRWLPDGTIAVAIARERDFYAAPADLWAIDPADGRRTPLLTDVDHGLEQVAVGRDGTIVIGTELEARGRLLQLDDGAVVALAVPTTGGLSAPAPGGAGVYAVHASVTEPPEVVLVTVDEVRPVTSFARSLLAGRDLGRLEDRWVAGADGDDVHVLVLHPPAAAAPTNGPPPLLQLVHGGPHSTFGDTWHWRWCAARFAAAGNVVAMVNFHGSTSYGHAFTRSTHGDWATAPVQDVLAATDALVADGTVDGTRMAVAGGSYGGYLTVLLCTRTDRFAAAVAHAAVTDFGGMWATDWPNGFGGAFGAVLWKDPTATYAASPSWAYGAMRTPMLVTHGERDLRVPIDQGRALYGILQEMKIPSRLVVMPDENHWILDRATSERWYDEVLTWIARHR